MIKCLICEERFKETSDIIFHIEEEHADSIPKNFTAAQLYYSWKTGKVQGSCVNCKRETRWNESTDKYHRFCDRKECKEEYIKQFKERMIGKYGKTTLLKDPEQQKKMLANRSISGTYVWSDGGKVTYTGSYELDFLKFLDVFMNYSSDDIMCPSPHTYYYTYNGEEKFYIPDVFIPSLNLEIEIKDGGDNPNTHHKIQDVDKEKERLKDEVLMSQKAFSYIKLVNKGYDPFFKFLHMLKQMPFEPQGGSVKENEPIFIVNESYLPVATMEATIGQAERHYPVFILLTYTGTTMAKLIRFYTGDPYSHASISFDSSMDEIYSFGRKDIGDDMKFVQEDIHTGLIRGADDNADFSLYVTYVTKQQKEMMEKRLKEFKDKKDVLRFSHIGIFNIAFGRETDRENEYFCSQFVAEVLRAGKGDMFDRHSSLYSPWDLAQMDDVYYVTRGKVRAYKKQTVDQQVIKIRNKRMEGTSRLLLQRANQKRAFK